MRKKWTNDKIIESIRLFVKEQGKVPQKRDFLKSGGKYPSHDTVARYFGSWNSAIEASGFKPIRKEWTNNEIIESIQLFVKEHGKVPQMIDFKKSGGKYPSCQTVADYFGSWNRAIEVAGFFPNQKQWTEQEIIESIKLFVEEQGKVPKTIDFEKSEGKYPGYDTVVKYFGSWNSAIDAAGFKPNKICKTWTNNEIIEAIQLFVEEYGKVPQRRDFEKSDGKYPNATTVARYFGSWNHAIETAGFEPYYSKNYGVRTLGKDGHLYRSKAEAYFADTFLFGQYEYEVEPKYPEPHYKWYDWYIPGLDCYIELDGRLRPHVIQEKIEINKDLGRTLLVVSTDDIYKKDFRLL